MPGVKSRVALHVARGVNAFLNFDVGVVRGPAPNPERELVDVRAELKQRDEQVESLRRRLHQAQKPPKAKKAGPVEKKPDWFRGMVGGRWEEIGKLQFDFLREHGLKPEHRFLDVGCGSLRGGLRFIPYLERGHYYGIDRDERLLAAGRAQLEEARLQDRSPILLQVDDFGFERLGHTFDFALAQSVFTHLPMNLIARCLVNVDRVLNPGGVFFATFFENWNGKRYVGPLVQGDGVVSYYDRDPFHYTPDAFEWVCEGTGLTAEYIGDWEHPRHQLMFAFKKAA